MWIDTNCRVQLPGGTSAEADRQPASTDRLERAGLIGTGNAHLFFLRGAFELELREVLVLVARRQHGRMTPLEPEQQRRYEIRDVDTWDDHTEILTVATTAPGAPDPAFDFETWTLVRQVKTGNTRPSGLEETREERLSVQIAVIPNRERGDDVGDRTYVNAEIVAYKGTLQNADGLVPPGGGFFEVRNVVPDGDYERGVLLG